MTATAAEFVETKLGVLRIDSRGRRIVGVSFEDLSPEALCPLAPCAAGSMTDAARQLREFAARERRVFDLELAPEGTDFQQRVWKALRAISFGETISYAQLAERIDSPKAVRAVANACGANPIPIIIPCHRVIGADGGLGGFSCGVDRKRTLLALEGSLPAQERQAGLFPAAAG